MRLQVMVMTAGSSRLKSNVGKEIVAATESIGIDVSDDRFDALTNDHGDVFYEPETFVSTKLVNPFRVRTLNDSIKEVNEDFVDDNWR